MISIIIPTLNEEGNISRLLNYLNQQTAGKPVEILVSDGGSSDRTVQVARDLGAKVIDSGGQGRALQMNAGARQASGQVLYFLHSDTFPPHSFISDIERALGMGESCGCFLLSFDSAHPALRFFAWCTRFDLDIFRFGDQSLFVKKDLFQQVSGFNENLRVMEDQEMVKRLKRRAQFYIIPEQVVTSARKYEQIGVFKLQFIFTIIVLLFYLGVSQEVIVHFYQRVVSV